MQKKNAVGTGPTNFSPRVGAVSDCLEGKGRGYHGLEDVTRVFSLANPTSFQYEFKEHSGEKVSVRDIPKSQGCGERAAQQAQLCLGTGAKAGQGRDEHHCS